MHRYMGFLLIVIMVIYALSGIVLVYRDTNIFKKDVHIERDLGKGLDERELGAKLRMRDFKVEKTEGDIVYFKAGTYNKATGMASYASKDYPWLIKEMNSFHLAHSKHRYSLLAVLFGVALFLFAISSFWMFPPKSKIFKRGLVFAGVGTLLGIMVLFF